MQTIQNKNSSTGRVSLVHRIEALNDQFADINKRAERLRQLSEALVFGSHQHPH